VPRPVVVAGVPGVVHLLTLLRPAVAEAGRVRRLAAAAGVAAAVAAVELSPAARYRPVVSWLRQGRPPTMMRRRLDGALAPQPQPAAVAVAVVKVVAAWRFRDCRSTNRRTGGSRRSI
jgi:hypothetical protein